MEINIDYPAFELAKSRYNLETFSGRFLQSCEITDQRTLFVRQKKLDESVKLLNDFKEGRIELNSETNERLWKAQKIKQAMIHPDTGQAIYKPFRMASYIPLNSVICAGILNQNPSVLQTIFWQWINQSHNACLNYANRNASKPVAFEKCVEGYLCAVGASVSISVGLNQFLKRTKMFTPSLKMTLLRFTPLPAVIIGSTVNVILMRCNELKTGVDVYDKEGRVLGSSKLAAQYGLMQIATTRAFLGLRLVVPSLISVFVEKFQLIKKNPRLMFPFNFLFCYLTFNLSLPATMAIYPSESKIATKDLECNIQEKTSDNFVYFNRGL